MEEKFWFLNIKRKTELHRILKCQRMVNETNPQRYNDHAAKKNDTEEQKSNNLTG